MDSKVFDTMLRQAREGDATAAVALALYEVAAQLQALGKGDGVNMGAVESLAAATKEGLWDVADALRGGGDGEPIEVSELAIAETEVN
jgi:hypothetical protein